jgi:hypothetical protein
VTRARRRREARNKKIEDAVRSMRRLYHDAIAKEIETTSKTYAEIAQQYGVSEQTIYTVACERGLRRNSQQSVNQPDIADADLDARGGGLHE